LPSATDDLFDAVVEFCHAILPGGIKVIRPDGQTVAFMGRLLSSKLQPGVYVVFDDDREPTRISLYQVTDSRKLLSGVAEREYDLMAPDSFDKLRATLEQIGAGHRLEPAPGTPMVIKPVRMLQNPTATP
jgi:hypothetical protein